MDLRCDDSQLSKSHAATDFAGHRGAEYNMAHISFECSNCKHGFEAPEDMAGQAVECPASATVGKGGDTGVDHNTPGHTVIGSPPLPPGTPIGKT